MSHRRELRLKPLQSDNPDTVRIYDQAREACQRLNTYLFDFIETIAILRENRGKGKTDGTESEREIDTYIESVERKIDDIGLQMEGIAKDLSFLVDLVDEHHGRDTRGGTGE